MKIINWCKENYILLGIIILSFAFRIYNLDFQSPWGDEIFTLIFSHSDKSLGEIFEVLKGDVHPPLYYYTIHFFLEIFGDSIYVARFVSLLFGVGGIVVLYYLGKELFNKNVALIAVALLCINHFDIYYSQDARMYTMLFFSTTLSFLFLIRYIKTPTLKSALIYSFSTALLVNTHFYALFALCTQYLIILYFIIKPYNTTWKRIFFHALISGIITLISFIPSLVIFLSTKGIKSFWIPVPERDVYTTMFKEFFGFSEIAIVIAVIAILYFLYKVFNEEESSNYKINPVTDKPVFAFQILFIWIFMCIFIPFLLSFAHLPMIVSRYFINVLPPVFLLIAAGINYIKNSTVKVTLISVFIIFSLTDLVFVKNYYNKNTKTQFREASIFVKEHHKNNEKIYSTFEFFFSYYLRPEEHHKVINNSLNEIAYRITNENEKPESFWYVNPLYFDFPDKDSESTLKLLDSLYVVDEKLELFDAAAKHYHTRADYKPTGGIEQFKPYKDRNGSEAEFSIEVVKDLGRKVTVTGWAYFHDQSMEKSKISIVLVTDKKDIVLDTESVLREDVTTYFKSKYDLSNSGFTIQIDKTNLEPGTYKLALYLTDPVTKKESLLMSDKTITK
ncbi:hypothetical protein Q765_14445 [Flavobacterium rivuli WB 3.3-2 = DSM 21788]|uniref:Glycosyltransferase RgtA/B/C/D-like domain-containing protein n=1 Tax=Flavobacterium rivuli WB 3.3-2 = DSM 21788 TaxID=1121895 RepID=A0A0A2M2I8_9FLAO|nr:glycosyltransferase family 39 protein [Flavobacterium rivuli]KGO85821.1 hypothetical protein Q765_14445 [Flavobacterium rivuli WB 3.3-2 = DSM 21788]